MDSTSAHQTLSQAQLGRVCLGNKSDQGREEDNPEAKPVVESELLNKGGPLQTHSQVQPVASNPDERGLVAMG